MPVSDGLLILDVFSARVGYHKDNDVWSDVLGCLGLRRHEHISFKQHYGSWVVHGVVV